MPYFLAISGYRKAGKSTLGIYLVNKLTELGYKVSVVKSCHEEEILTDIPQKDTWNYRESGASAVGLFQKNFFTLYLQPEKLNLSSYKDWYSYFLSLFWGYDLVLFEGFKQFDILPKIWVVRDEKENLQEIKKEVRNLLAFVVKNNKEIWIKNYPKEVFFNSEEKDKILNFVIELINKHKQKVLLRVNGKKIPLKDFVENMLAYPIIGCVKALKNIPPEINEIEIKIKVSNLLDKKAK